MAAPADKTTKNLSGKWVLNRTLSDSPEPGLVIQGIGFFIRKGISMATISIDVTQYEAPPKPPSTATDSVTHIDIDQSASGLTSTKELRCLDDTPREHTDWIFGTVEGRSRWVALADIGDDFLKQGWDVDADAADGRALIMNQATSEANGWTARQVWGFQTVDGERRHCRNIVITKGDERAEFRFVYDWSA